MSSDEDIECVEVRAARGKKTVFAKTQPATRKPQQKQQLYDGDDSAEIVQDSSSDSDGHDESAQSSSCLDESKASADASQTSENQAEDEPVPSGGECLTRCAQFAEVTGTDKALAMFYLQDTNWNLERALDAYYKTTNKNSKAKIVACFDVGKLNRDERDQERKRASKGSRSSRKSESSEEAASNESSPKRSKARTSEPTSPTEEQLELMKSEIAIHQEQKQSEMCQEESKHFKILSWNIDGLDKSNLESRTLGVVSTIMKERPDVVLLQEVVVESQAILMKELGHLYDKCTGNKVDYLDAYDPTEALLRRELQRGQDKSYYTMILSKKSSCKMSTPELIDFPNSVMTRNLLKVKLKYKDTVEFYAMTAHLESTKDFAKQRIDQLKICFEAMTKSIGDSTPAFFGGDLNLRDTELSAIGGLPSSIHDVWEATGSRKECLYTWDQMRNDNLRMNGKFKPRCRFDRLYYKPATKKSPAQSTGYTLMPVYFELEGLSKLKSCGRFPSDHWAIQSYCQIEELKC